MLTRRNTLRLLGTAAGSLAVRPASAGWLSRKPDLRDAERFAFVPSHTAPVIAAIDLQKARLAATIELPHVPADIVVSKMLGMVFATNPEAGTLTPVMLETQDIAPPLDVGLRPDHALLGFEDQFAAFWSDTGELIVWDLKNIKPIYHNAGFQPGAQVSFSVTGRGLYVVEGQNNQVITVDLEKNRLSGVVPLHLEAPSGKVSAVTRSMDGGRGFVAVEDQDKLVVLDLKEPGYHSTITIEGGPLRPYSTGDGRLVLVPSRATKTVSVLDTASHALLRQVELSVTPSEINTGWFDTLGFVMSDKEKAIDVLDLSRLVRRGQIMLPEVGDHGVVNADMRVLAVAMAASGEVALIDATRGEVHSIIDARAADIHGIRLGVSNNICH